MIKKPFINKLPVATSAGSIVMAIGIFSLYALHTLADENLWIEKIIAAGLFIIWLYLARIYFINYRRGILIQSNEDLLGIGTWVAGSAVLAMSCYLELSWQIIAYVFLFIAFIIWIVYLKLLYFYFTAAHCKQQSINGSILLSTVSTQSIVIASNILFSQHIPLLMSQLIISFGYFLYFISLLIMIKHFASQKIINIKHWSNTNSILHGALSITGLASLTANLIDNELIIVTWLTATCLFILVEGISLIKACCRIKSYGLIQGLFTYDLSQWSRLFTYGMYYAFTLSMCKAGLINMPFIIAYGPYVVLFILVLEIVIMLI